MDLHNCYSGQCEHRYLSTLGPFKSAEKTGKALSSSLQKRTKDDAVREDSA